MSNEITGYHLSRNWFDFCFENPEKINPNHSAIFFFAIEHCNRMGWKAKFGFPTQMAMDAIGIKKHQTYIKYFNQLCEWQFFILVQKSTNQFSANIISLSIGMPKNGKALSRATLIHAEKCHAENGQSNAQSNAQSNSSIDKPITIHTQDLSKSNLFRQPTIPTKNEVWEVFSRNGGTKEMAKKFFDNNESVNWFIRGSPITNFSNLVPGFIAAWQKNEKKDPHKQDSAYKPISEIIGKYDK